MRVRKIKPPHVVENPDVKREWLSKLRAFKQGVRLRAKLGVLDKYLQDVGAARRRGTYERPHWGCYVVTSIGMVHQASGLSQRCTGRICRDSRVHYPHKHDHAIEREVAGSNGRDTARAELFLT